MAVLAVRGCGGSSSGGSRLPPADTFVSQSVFLGSCTSASECYSSRQNSGFEIDVRADFEQSCTYQGDAYSTGACAGSYARCCLQQMPSSVAPT